MIRWLSICAAFATIGVSNGQQFLNRTRRQNGPSCFTPNQIQGICLNIRQCPQLLRLLQFNRSLPGVIEFLRSSKCNPQVASEVCCPDTNPRNAEDYGVFMSPPNCGKTGVKQVPRIVNGQPADLGAWPWITLLGYRNGRFPGPYWECGGALVSERFVVTAAHCIKPHNAPQLILYVVRLGESELNNETDGASPIDIRVENAIAHPSYSYSTKLDDIGLIKLERSVQFTKHIQPICLPKPPELRSRNFEQFNPFVAGWGKISGGGVISQKLLQIQVPVTDNESCDKAYTSKGVRIVSRQLCAGYPNGGKDACQGDSGGPLMLPNENGFYLIGVVSYGYGCAQPGFPGVYTRVTSYLDWLANHMSQ